MSKDPDLERDLERVMSRIDLPEQERWVPNSVTGRARKPVWAFAAAGTAVVIALAVGVASQSASDIAASRSPLSSPPVLTRGPVPSPSPTGSVPPRGTAVVGPAGTVLDLTEESGSAAADDHALAAVPQHAAKIVVTEVVGGQKHTVLATRGQQFLAPHGALRGDLVAYIETEFIDANRVVRHVMVANWRTGAVTELDAIPGEYLIAPGSPDSSPKAYTNGRDVIWLRTSGVDGQLPQSELVLWRDGKSTVVYRGEVSYALADDGRIAIVELQCPPAARVRTCPTGTRWALSLLEGSGFTARIIATRDRPDGVGGPPAFAGNSIVWPRVSTAAIAVTTVDIIDVQTGDTRTVTNENCSWIGSTVREVVFSCPDSVLRVHPVASQVTVIWSSEAGSHYFVADPHAIIGRRIDARWIIRPVP